MVADHILKLVKTYGLEGMLDISLRMADPGQSYHNNLRVYELLIRASPSRTPLCVQFAGTSYSDGTPTFCDGDIPAMKTLGAILDDMDSEGISYRFVHDESGLFEPDLTSVLSDDIQGTICEQVTVTELKYATARGYTSTDAMRDADCVDISTPWFVGILH